MPALSDEVAFPRARAASYLDTASVALLSTRTRSAVHAWLDRIACEGTRWFHEEEEERVLWPARRAVSRLLGVDFADVVIGSSASELLGSLAWAVAPPPGSNVVGTAMAFPSTNQPWARVVRDTAAALRLTGKPGGPLSREELVRAVDRHTAVVCVSDVEYQTGEHHDLAMLAAHAHRVGALLIVDASQSLGVLPLDPTTLGVDAVVASGYKWMCGPFGAAAMYLAPALRARLDPGVIGFRSAANMWALHGHAAPLADSAARFESGSLFYGAARGLETAIGELEQLGGERIHAHAIALAGRLARALGSHGADVWPRPDDAATAIVAAAVPEPQRTAIAAALRHAGIAFSERAGRLRFSAHLYNDDDDADHVAEVFRNAGRR